MAEAGPSGATEAGLAGRLGYSERYVRVWCRAAYAYEILDWEPAGGYTLPAGLDAVLLDAAHARHMGGRVQFDAGLHEDFRAFPRYLRSGATWPRAEHDPSLLEALGEMTRPDARVLAEVIASQATAARARLAAGGALLDVGTGAGHALVEYARRFPEARVVGIDPDAASVDLARRAVAEAGLGDRVEVRQVDATRLDEEARYDVVTMNIALAGVQLHEAIVGCGAITTGDLRALLEDAAFGDVRVADQPLPSSFVLLAARS